MCYSPALIARYALLCWNRSLMLSGADYRQIFLAQARWLVKYQQRGLEFAGGWIVASRSSVNQSGRSYLSASVQGNALSVLIRAYQLTDEEVFLRGARLALEPFKRDIFDGGICAPVGEDGIFFQDEATYPATHVFTGCAFALLGLYEYLAFIDGTDAGVQQLIERCLKTLHILFDEFDVGFWTRLDLYRRCFVTPDQLALQTKLLALLARYSQCEHCSDLAVRWEMYRQRFIPRQRYQLGSRLEQIRLLFWNNWQKKLFPHEKTDEHSVRVAISVYGFPSPGGTRAVLANLAQTMNDLWQIEYVTQTVVAHTEAFIVHQFGTRRMAPWQFPAVWFYVLAGCKKLISLLRHEAGYTLILPQDGVYSAAFSALVARLAGIQVVCIDHGNLTLLDSHAYRKERIQSLETKGWSRPRILFARLRFLVYWPSLRLLAMIAARLVDHYLVPGIAGDGVEEDCLQVGIPRSRFTRFASMVDINQHILPDEATKASIRATKQLAADAIVIAIICRLSPEKGLDVALEGLSQALAALSAEQRERIRIMIAGDGPLRGHMEDEVMRRGLGQNCVFGGETSHADVITLLGISDIFLYTSTRGACFSMAVLEAMASACAVIATTEPMSNRHLLAEGRGIAVPAGATAQIAAALLQLAGDRQLCQHMGQMAREYIVQKHSPAVFRKTLLRVTGWSGLDTLVVHDGRTADALEERSDQ